jgi:hypothetical protein
MEKSAHQYAMIQTNLGNALGTLAEVEDKLGNTKKAIDAYEQALRVFTVEKFPVQYRLTKQNQQLLLSTK